MLLKLTGRFHEDRDLEITMLPIGSKESRELGRRCKSNDRTRAARQFSRASG